MAKLIGDKALMKALKKEKKKNPDGLMVALYWEALKIFAESQEEVPVDTGRLRASGLVFPETDRQKVTVSYGTAYAVKIHEATELDAKRHARAELALSNPGVKIKGAQTGKSKYLQDPFERASSGMMRRVLVNAKKARNMGLGAESTSVVKGKSKE